MRTSRLLLLAFAVLGLLSAVAIFWRPAGFADGRKPLVWVTDNAPSRSDQIRAFNELHSELNLGLDYANAGVQKVILQARSGIGPDLFDIYNGEELQTYAEAGVALDVTEAAEKEGFSAWEDCWPSSEGEITYQGRQYSYPCNTNVNILIYNKNLFDHLGLPYPKEDLTWEEFAALARRIKVVSAEKGDPVFPVAALSWKNFFESLRGEYFDQDGNLRIADSPELKRAFELYRNYLFEDRLLLTSAELRSMSGQGGWGAGNFNQFAAGRFAMVVVGKWALMVFGRSYDHQLRHAAGRDPAALALGERPLRLGAVRLPRFAGREPAYRIYSRSVAVNAKSPRREEARRFLQYLAGPEYARILNRDSDALPGNPLYADLGLPAEPADLAPRELHERTLEAMKYGYSPRRSPLLLGMDIERVLAAQVSRLESNPRLPTEALLAEAQRELDALIKRNLSRNPALAAAHPSSP